MNNQELQQCMEWLAGQDTGISSKTIVSIIVGIQIPEHGHPHDMGDVGRCIRMLRKLPFLRPRLGMVILRFPYWMPFIDCWEHLERLYDECIKFEQLPEIEQKKLKRRKHFKTPHLRAWNLMQELTCASRYLRGMRMQNSPSHWQNKAPERY